MNKDRINILEIKNILKSYGEFPVLKDISLSIESGEFLTIFGASGSGKSTLLKVISGIETFETGSIHIEGKNVEGLPPEKRKLGFVFQKPLLFPHMTVYENVAFGLKVLRKSKDYIDLKVKDLLASTEMSTYGNHYPNELSGGQQQRIAIARALAIEPPLLLLDEPFNGLDQKLRIEMGNLLKKLQRNYGVSITFVTHDVDEALRLSDKVAVLDEGKILQCGDSHEVYYYPKNKKVSELMGPGNWIEGYVDKEIFYSPFGQHPAPDYNPGKYELFLRPHQIKENQLPKGIKCRVIEVSRKGRSNQIVCKFENIQVVFESMISTNTYEDLTEIYLMADINMPQLIKYGRK